ncbi:MAG: hypothetical protein ACYTG4_14020, partial [Planctomycetota bacterium]
MAATLSRAFVFSLAAHLTVAGGWFVLGPLGGDLPRSPGRVEVRWDESTVVVVPPPEVQPLT